MNSSEPVGAIRALWRFPVKSMVGEELDAADLGEGGIVGDRAYALVGQGIVAGGVIRHGDWVTSAERR